MQTGVLLSHVACASGLLQMTRGGGVFGFDTLSAIDTTWLATGAPAAAGVSSYQMAHCRNVYCQFSQSQNVFCVRAFNTFTFFQLS